MNSITYKSKEGVAITVAKNEADCDTDMVVKIEKRDAIFAGRLKKCRLKRQVEIGEELTQKAVAAAAGISDRSYWKAESGIIPGFTVLSKIAKYYNVTVEYLKTDNAV